MAITASGLYYPSMEKVWNNTAAIDIEAETMKAALFLDALTPDFVANATYAATNEASGTGYTAGGKVLLGTEITGAGGVFTFDASDLSWAGSTIPNAMAAQIYADAVADELIALVDFVTAVSTTGGAFNILWHALGIFTIDHTP